jgi:hypothetical protein
MSRGYGTQLLKPGTAQINPGLRLHYVTAGDGDELSREVGGGLSLEGASAAALVKSMQARG